MLGNVEAAPDAFGYSLVFDVRRIQQGMSLSRGELLIVYEAPSASFLMLGTLYEVLRTRQTGENSARWNEAAESDQKRSSLDEHREPTHAQKALLHESILDGVVRDVRVGPHRHLLQDPRSIGTDSLDRQIELVGNLRDGKACSQFAEDLKLAL